LQPDGLHPNQPGLQFAQPGVGYPGALLPAIQVLCYEIYRHQYALTEAAPRTTDEQDLPASSGEVEGYFEHLQKILELTGFLNPQQPGLIMQRLRRLYLRSEVSRNEINILRGMLTAIEKPRR